MRRYSLVVVYVAFIATTLCAAESANELTGRVVDENGQPVAGARVAAMTLGPAAGGGIDRRLSVLTGPDGTFRLDGGKMPLGVMVVASKEGKCLDWIAKVAATGKVVFRLGPAASIEGQVVDETGQPVTGASVRVLLRKGTLAAKEMLVPLSTPPFATRTDSRGRYRFDGLPDAATAKFDITAPGRARALAEGPFVPGQKGLRFVLPPEGRLEGAVVEKATGQPLADVSVHIVGSLTSGIQQASGKTDKAGRFRFSGLSGGKYRVQVGATGDALPQWIGSQEKVRVDNGKTATVNIEAIPSGVLEVVLTDAASGKPITARRPIHVSPAEDLRVWESGFASKDGVARFHLRPGKWIIREVWIASYSYKREKGRFFSVVGGKTTRAVLKLTAVPRMVLAVRDPLGKAVAGAKAQLLPFLGPPRDLAAGQDGRLTVDAADIGPLFCFLLVRHPRQNLSAVLGLTKDEKPPQVTLRPPTKVSGVAVDARGRPVAGVTVQAQIDASHFGRFAVVATTRTDKDGRYQMDLPHAGVMAYAASGAKPGYTLAEALLSQPELAKGQVKAKDLVLRSANRVVRGVVRDEQGRPVAGAVVTAKRSGGPSFAGSAVTDERGKFVLDRLDDSPLVWLFVRVPGRGWIGDRTIEPGETDPTIRVRPSHWD